MTLNITDAELHEWANMRADDAGRLARELVACRLQSQAAVAAAYEAAARVVDNMRRDPQYAGSGCDPIIDAIRALATPDQIAALAAERAKLDKAVEVLRWYADQTRLCRLIHSEGDAGRNALAADGGTKARAVLAEIGVA